MNTFEKLFSKFSFVCFVLFFVVCFSRCAHADYTWSTGTAGCTSQPSPYDACTCYGAHLATPVACSTVTRVSDTNFNWSVIAGNGSTITGAATRSGTSCDAGKTFNSATGACDVNCTVAGQVHNQSGACLCPSGTFDSKGDMFSSINGGVAEACRTMDQHCAALAGQSRSATWPASASEGCVMTCATNAGADKAVYPYTCTYTGGKVGGATNSTVGTGQSSPISSDPIAPTIPPGCTSSATTACSGGSKFGFVNGQAVCASTSSNCAAGSTTSSGTPISNGTPAGTTVTSTTSSTTTNADGSTTTTTVNTIIGGTGTNGSGTGTGTGTGSGSGNGTGGGDCNPDSKNYLDCQQTGAGPTHTTNANSSAQGAFENYGTSMQSVPLVQAFSGVSNAFSTSNAQCPTPSFEAFGQTFQIDLHCTLYESVQGVLSAVMLIVWGYRGFKIIASA